MKVLIWFLCIFANALFTTLIKKAGVLLGAIPTVILYGAACWLARTLCKKWDEHKENKAVNKNVPVQTVQITPADTTDQVRFCRKCGEKLINGSQFCRKCGTEIGTTDEDDIEAPSSTSRDPNASWLCEKCGVKNLSTRNDCWSCGNPK